ncbi:phosphorylase, putative [Bodo saltans]|uniref:Phosphorylase, putative n=1 Tax=Bodo saltans TaxID=75058 RepID=A0A0S4ILN1_BODSA|nr:phosphorylase, putative [Bodo saltans]|eukprot:CUE71652.1 phosphorylase, putative [Bodo saltans]
MQLHNGSIANIVLVTTGIGALNAALCTTALLRLPSLQFLEIIFTGTSGFSPVLGGFEPTAPGGCHSQYLPTTVAIGSVCVTSTAYDGSCGECISNPYADGNNLPNECSRPNCANHTSTSLFGKCSEDFLLCLVASNQLPLVVATSQYLPTTVAIGSVCVTSTAYDGSCGECISNPYADGNNLPNECSRPNCANHTSTSLFGKCSETLPNGLALSIVAANSGVTFPTQSAAVVAGSVSWWAAHEVVDDYTRQHPPSVPTLHTNCAEIDVRQISPGAPLDYLCREYSAELLGLTPATTLCVAAMESTGFLQAVRQSQQKNVKVAVVRAASNWDMFPLSAAPGEKSLRWNRQGFFKRFVNRNRKMLKLLLFVLPVTGICSRCRLLLEKTQLLPFDGCRTRLTSQAWISLLLRKSPINTLSKRQTLLC